MLNKLCAHFTTLIVNGPAEPLRMLVHSYANDQHHEHKCLPNWRFLSDFDRKQVYLEGLATFDA